MNSMVRLQILSLIRLLEPCSVTEIAARMKRNPETLYYHMDILRAVGLVAEQGSRLAGRREETLYHVPHKRLRFHPSRRTPRFLANLRQVYSKILRTVERRVNVATGAREECREGPAKNVRVQAYTVELSADELAELNRRLEHVRSFLLERNAPERRGLPMQVLLVTTPLVEERGMAD